MCLIHFSITGNRLSNEQGLYFSFLVVFFSSRDYLSEILKENDGGGDSYDYDHNLPFFLLVEIVLKDLV